MSDVMAALGGLLALIALGIGAAFGFINHGERKGRETERKEAINADRKKADDIRRAARDADGVYPEYENRGYRD